MDPEAYLQRYLAPFLPPASGEEESEDSIAVSAVTPELATGYYDPPGPEAASYLDVLSRAELLDLLWQLLAVEYPQRRLTRRHVGSYGELLQHLKQDQAWRRAEMERLNAERPQFQAEIQLLETEQRRLESLIHETQAEAVRWQEISEARAHRIVELEARSAELQAILADLRASTSWRLTAPLRRLSRSLQAWRTPEA